MATQGSVFQGLHLLLPGALACILLSPLSGSPSLSPLPAQRARAPPHPPHHPPGLQAWKPTPLAALCGAWGSPIPSRPAPLPPGAPSAGLCGAENQVNGILAASG